MNSLIGLGVFGTFGQPFGFRQAFNSEAVFSGSLDLDQNAIEVYPGNDLFAVRRAFVDGISTVCFCMYTYARELHSDRVSTFIGTCVVLRDAYVDADNIYKLLKDLHEDTIGNVDNVDDSTIKVQQASDIIVNEPGSLIAVRANAIPLSKTPFYSTGVNAQKKILVSPDDSRLGEADKVIAFFDEALKYHTDTATLFFTFDNDVAGFAYKKAAMRVIDWDEFLHIKRLAQQQAVVRTKKGIQKNMPVSQVGNVATMQADAAAAQLADAFDDDVNEDPYKPFDVWEEPRESWSAAEVRYRVREYNRLFKYTNTLQAHINEMGSSKKKKHQKQQTKAEKYKGAQKSAGNQKLSGTNRRNGVLIIVVLGTICLGAGIYNSFFNKSNQSIVSTNIPAAAIAAEPLADSIHMPVAPAPVAVAKPAGHMAPKAIAKAAPPAAEPKKALPEEYRAEDYEPAPAVKKNTDKPAVATAKQETTILRPTPNFEMSQKDIASLAQAGIKNKSVADITRMIFDAVPTNVGSIYNGQEAEYATVLLNNNRQSFQKVGNDYVCNSDAVTLHIPAYKTPRLPVVSPK